MDELSGKITSVNGEEQELKLKFDTRALLLGLRIWVLPLLLLFFVTLAIGWGGFRQLARRSNQRFSAVAKIFHQNRSDRVPSFYKQLSPKTIAQLIGTSATMRRAAEKLKLPKRSGVSLGQSVTVAADKNKTNVISITANHRDAKLAAAMANAVAEAGLEEYVELQNATLKTILVERRRRRAQLVEEMSAVERQLPGYHSDISVPPDEELPRLRIRLEEGEGVLRTQEMRRGELQIRLEEISRRLAETPKEIKTMSKIHGGDNSELERLQKEFVKFEQIYTPDNPRLRGLAVEIRAREKMLASKPKQESDELVFEANPIYSSLLNNQIQTQMDMKTLDYTIDAQKKLLERFRARTQELVPKVAAYTALQRRIGSLKISIQQLETGINELDFLLTSTIPDLSIQELANVPSRANKDRTPVFALVFAVFVTGMALAALLGYEIFLGRLRSAREFTLIGGLDNLGEIPLQTERTGPQTVDSALLNSFQNLRGKLGDGRILYLCRLDSSAAVDRLREQWQEQFQLNGCRVFRLAVVTQREGETIRESHRGKEFRNLSGDDGLVYVEQFGTHGIFVHNDDSYLSAAEEELLRADLKVLSEHFDLVEVMRGDGAGGGDLLAEQLVRLCSYTGFVAEFNRVSRAHFCRFVEHIAQDGEPIHGGGVLTAVPYPFWRK